MAREKKKSQSFALAWSFAMKLYRITLPKIPSDVRALASIPLTIRNNEITKAKSSKSAKPEKEYIAYQFVGYPTDEQKQTLLQNIGVARWMWNRMKYDHDITYKETGTNVWKTPADYKKLDEYSWLKDVDSLALCNAQLNLQKAYKSFFDGRAGYPKFKKKALCKAAYTTNSVNNSIRLDNGRLVLPKVNGPIRLRIHRDIPNGMTVKSCNVCHKPDGKWMFTILCESASEPSVKIPNVYQLLLEGDREDIRHIGLDMSLPEMYVDSDGCVPSYVVNDVLVGFRKCYRGLEDRIAKEQRKLSHMVKDSNNYKKQCAKIASLHAKAKHQRNDFLHQIAVRLARSYDVISIEDLDMNAMKQSLRLGKSVSDNGWGMFVRILEEKCEQYGCTLVKVSRWFPSSKTCSHCGHIHKELKLNDRTYICPKCGHVMDGDYQAAVNIDREGIRMILDFYDSRHKAS